MPQISVLFIVRPTIFLEEKFRVFRKPDGFPGVNRVRI